MLGPILFIACVIGVGLVMGAANAPDGPGFFSLLIVMGVLALMIYLLRDAV